MKKALLLLCCIISHSLGFSQQAVSSVNGNTSKKILNNDEEYNFQIISTNDSLSARYDNDSIGVKYKYLELPITNTHQLDEYLKNNISEINKKRVMFGIIHKVSTDSFRAVKNILLKYKIYHPAAMIE